MKKLGFSFLITFLISSLVLPAAFAHLRTYAFNQEYQTIPQGSFEWEQWTTLSVPDGSKTRENEWQYQSELEYGITDHFTIANYQRWKTINVEGPDDSTIYEGFKFEGKYRIGERGKYWVDPLIYVEWKTDPREHEHHNELESKLILSKDFGKFNVVTNQIMENQLSRDGRTNYEFTIGANYEVLSDFRVGVEMEGDYWRPSSHRNRIAMGPTLAWQGKYFWIVAGALFGVNHAADNHEVRLIVGLPLPFDTTQWFEKVSTGTTTVGTPV